MIYTTSKGDFDMTKIIMVSNIKNYGNKAWYSINLSDGISIEITEFEIPREKIMGAWKKLINSSDDMFK